MYKLIIFDLDDCLVDTWSASFPESIKDVMQAMINQGLKVKNFNKATKRFGKINDKSKNSAEAITDYLNEIGENTSKYVEHGKKAIHYFNLEGKIKPLPEALKTIKELDKLGINMVIITRGGMERQMKKMDDAGIDVSKFKKILAVTDYDKTVPYKKVLNEFDCSPKEVLVIGDRYKTDLIPASNLGMSTAWIPWGRGKIFVPKKNEVDYILPSLGEILEIVKNRNT